jgi:hypothetical protein
MSGIMCMTERTIYDEMIACTNRLVMSRKWESFADLLQMVQYYQELRLELGAINNAKLESLQYYYEK